MIVDNTLVDRSRQLIRYSERFAEGFAEDLQPVEFAKLHEEVVAGDGGGYQPKEEMFLRLQERLAWRQVPGVERIRAHWSRHSPLCVVEMEGAVELL